MTAPAPEPAGASRGLIRRPARTRRRRDERGGAVSLWVVLMVPVSAFAAVVAMAGPQRLAAESSVQEAAEDLAVFAVVWRDGQQTVEGVMPAFPPDCMARTPAQEAEFTALQARIDALNPTDPNLPALILQLDIDLDALFGEFWLPPPGVATTINELQDKLDDFYGSLDTWEQACRPLAEALLRDLGYLGMDMGSLRGFYSDSLGEVCSDRQYTTEAACTGAGETWAGPGVCSDPAHTTPAACTGATPPGTWLHVPCWISQLPGGQAMVVRDAVHVALVARWQDAGWAAAQVWPNGLPMAAESIGRLSQRDLAPPADQCVDQLDVLDSQGRPVWAGNDPAPDSRQLAESVPRRLVAG